MSRLAKRPQVNHKLTALALRQRPGVWLVVGEYRSSSSAAGVARDIRTAHQRYPEYGLSPYAPAGSFETRTVAVEDGTRVDARYIGGVRD